MKTPDRVSLSLELSFSQSQIYDILCNALKRFNASAYAELIGDWFNMDTAYKALVNEVTCHGIWPIMDPEIQIPGDMLKQISVISKRLFKTMATDDAAPAEPADDGEELAKTVRRLQRDLKQALQIIKHQIPDESGELANLISDL